MIKKTILKNAMLRKFILPLLVAASLTGCASTTANTLPAASGSTTEYATLATQSSAGVASSDSSNGAGTSPFDVSSLPEYTGSASIIINDNVPYFTDEEILMGAESFISLSELDSLGRCGVAFASVSTDTMPTEERGAIGSVKPTGWHTVKYAGIDGNYLYNRCHLLMYALTGLNAEPKNLITGTRYLNIEGNLPYEESIVNYIKKTGNHVLYRVTPIFEGNNLLCSGELMEAYSVEDNGAFQFSVYCFNVQPGVTINYATGDSSGPEFTGSATTSISAAPTSEDVTGKNVAGTNDDNAAPVTYILNTSSKKFHLASCDSVAKMSEKNKQEYSGTREELIEQGYTACGACKP